MATPKLTLEEQLTKAKLRALAQGVQVWKLESEPTPRYAVPSASMDGTAYEVVVYDKDAGDITCTCPGHVHRGVCKHMGAILVRIDQRTRWSLPAPGPPKIGTSPKSWNRN